MRAPVATLTVDRHSGAARRPAVAAEGDLRDAGGVDELVTVEGDEPGVEVELAAEE